MQQILDCYNEVFIKWSDQKLKINDIERDILYLESNLKAEKEANAMTIKNEVRKAGDELKEAETYFSGIEAGLTQIKSVLMEVCGLYTGNPSASDAVNRISTFKPVSSGSGSDSGPVSEGVLNDFSYYAIKGEESSMPFKDECELVCPVLRQDKNFDFLFENEGSAKVECSGKHSVEELEKELSNAKRVVESCREFCDFVAKTYEEQMKLWEVTYERYSLRISNLQERLKVEEAVLDSYSTELKEWKSKLQAVLKKNL